MWLTYLHANRRASKSGTDRAMVHFVLEAKRAMECLAGVPDGKKTRVMELLYEFVAKVKGNSVI